MAEVTLDDVMQNDLACDSTIKFIGLRRKLILRSVKALFKDQIESWIARKMKRFDYSRFAYQGFSDDQITKLLKLMTNVSSIFVGHQANTWCENNWDIFKPMLIQAKDVSLDQPLTWLVLTKLTSDDDVESLQWHTVSLEDDPILMLDSKTGDDPNLPICNLSTFHLPYFPSRSPCVLEFMVKCPHVKKIQLGSKLGYAHNSCNECKTSLNRMRDKVSSLKVYIKDPRYLPSLLKDFRSLEKLSLYFHDLNLELEFNQDSVAAKVQEYLKAFIGISNATVKDIYLSNCDGRIFDSRIITTIGHAFSNIRSLYITSLSNPTICFGFVLKSFPKLEELKINTDVQCDFVAEPIRPNLKNLTIFHNMTTQALIHVLSSCPHLENLRFSLSEENEWDDKWDHLKPQLPRLKSLTLDIFNGPINYSCTMKLFSFLSSTRSLRVVWFKARSKHVQGNPPWKIDSLFDAVSSHLSSLRKLELDAHALHPRQLEIPLASLLKLQKLRKLCLNNFKEDPDRVHQLIAASSHLSPHSIYFEESKFEEPKPYRCIN